MSLQYWIIAATLVGIIFVALFVIYSKHLPDMFHSQDNAPTLGPRHWNPSNSTGEIEQNKCVLCWSKIF
jgi:hypothetical protein